MRLLRYLIPLLLCVTAFGQGLRPFGVSTAVNNSAVYDTATHCYIGSNTYDVCALSVGAGLFKQGMLFYSEEAGTNTIQPASILSTNSSGLVPINWQKVGSTKAGNGTFNGECFLGIPVGGASYSGTVNTIPLVTGGGNGNNSGLAVYSFGYMEQDLAGSASGRTCYGTTSGAQTITLAATNDIAVFTDFDANNTRTASGCTSSLDYSAGPNINYMGAHCSGSLSEALTWSGYYGSGSIALGQATPHDNGSTATPCQFEGYNRFDSGSSGTNIVGNYSTTVAASQHGNNPGAWAGAGTMTLDSTHTTTLFNNTSTLCGDLTSYSHSTSGQGVEWTGTGSAVANNIVYTANSGVTTLTAISGSIKICTDLNTTTMPSGGLDLANVLLSPSPDTVTAILFVGTGSAINIVIETGLTGNTLVVAYPIGGTCTNGGTGWVSVEMDTTSLGTGCSGGPCGTVTVKNYLGSVLGTTSTENHAGTGTVDMLLGTSSAETLASGSHVWYSNMVLNYQGTSPVDQ